MTQAPSSSARITSKPLRTLINISSKVTGFALMLTAGATVVAPMAHRDWQVAVNFAVVSMILFLTTYKLEGLLKGSDADPEDSTSIGEDAATESSNT